MDEIVCVDFDQLYRNVNYYISYIVNYIIISIDGMNNDIELIYKKEDDVINNNLNREEEWELMQEIP